MKALLHMAHEFPESLAALAINVFAHRAKKYLGPYLAILGGADAVVFGGGIEEHASDIPGRICEDMKWCGLRLDSSANLQLHGLLTRRHTPIQAQASGLRILVGRTDEEA
jgi:acetate kinase